MFNITIRRILTLSSLALLLATLGCHQSGDAGDGAGQQPTIVEVLSPGLWRVDMELPGGTMPVMLELDALGEGATARFLNGVEKVEVPVVMASPTRLGLEFPAFNNRMEVEVANGQARGQLTLVKRGYKQTIPVVLLADPDSRFDGSEPPAADITGRWQVEFEDDEGETSPAIGSFDQQGDVLTGTFMTPLGDYRYLAGNVYGDQVFLSTFDGAHVFLFKATIEDDGSLDGDFWSGDRWHEAWVAERNFDASLPNAYELTTMTEASGRMEFSFPATDRRQVSLDDEKYQGKVVIVALAGSWCPNCHDEAAFLSPWFRENRDRGVEVVGLMYEHLDEFEAAAHQVELFRDKFDIDYDLLIAGSSDKNRASQTLPMLNKVSAYPTMIFIDRSGQVRRIHTGFNGPGTGEAYEEFQQEFNSLMDELLAEPAPEAS